ncbi:glycoside hydrolase family 36 protein [Stackebrandtia nassauensis]|uniref:Glycoside hydrolase clan GH-D n=1 Tax=Stackebrandtia nassauensis (strain DSM 44728 / CIP 108903 / NRRL B-16338 / NBRC 102104 / LLR-40K-21) TaxID=446470 RepID=D3Q352_STANL|nr:glycoside hydrolase family 36 protein [Stackebrandtia nassauensis]ADD40022.1 glycoside hydrolase clan GH-D [Stackebrandtia nassauensis DSM 44728]
MTFDEAARLRVDPGAGRVYEHGWQSWSPTREYPVAGTSYRQRTEYVHTGHLRPEKPVPTDGFQAEGLLVATDADGAAHRFATGSATDIPSIRARLDGDRLVVTADGTVEHTVHADVDTALTSFGDAFAARAGVSVRPAPTVWCSWYHYFTDVTEADIDENLDAIGEHELPVDVIQIDDGWQKAVGDWLDLSDRFTSLSRIVKRINDSGRRAGVWVAPFLALATSDLVRDHPEWIIDGAAGHNWGTETRGVDPRRARTYLTDVFTMLREAGFDYFKLDFLYAGAIDSVEAYREGLAEIRRVVGPESYVLGCGAPILPSVGLVDAMRVGPDIAVTYEPGNGDPCHPSQRGAAANTIARAWQHGRFWANDPDCLIARPEVERREEWADTVERYGGLVSVSDRIAALDEWGMDTTRRLLSNPPGPGPLAHGRG